MNGALAVERIGPGGVVARVTLSRPEVHNAFDAALIGELRAAFTGLARDPAALVETSERRARHERADQGGRHGRHGRADP